jgi:large subunit ribosomal protein L25
VAPPCILLAALFLQNTSEWSSGMSGIVINVDVRERTGTGGAREIRRAGMVPGVLYGGPRGPVAIAAKGNELLKAIRSGKFLSHMVELKYGDETQPVIPKDIQWDPVKDTPVHFDLYRVEENSVIAVEVPVKFLNEDICPGLKRGGTLNVVRHMVSLDVKASAIPEVLEVDLANAKLGDVIHISAVAMPEGVRPTIRNRDFTIATIVGRGGAQADDAEA